MVHSSKHLVSQSYILIIFLFVLLPTGWWIWKVLLRILNWIISTFTSKTWPFQDFFPSWVPYQIEHIFSSPAFSTLTVWIILTQTYLLSCCLGNTCLVSPTRHLLKPYHLKWWVSKYFILRVVIITSPKYSQKSCEVDSIIIFPILQKCELRLRDSKSFPQGHSAGKWKRQTLNSGILSS